MKRSFLFEEPLLGTIANRTLNFQHQRTSDSGFSFVGGYLNWFLVIWRIVFTYQNWFSDILLEIQGLISGPVIWCFENSCYISLRTHRHWCISIYALEEPGGTQFLLPLGTRALPNGRHCWKCVFCIDEHFKTKCFFLKNIRYVPFYCGNLGDWFFQIH